MEWISVKDRLPDAEQGRVLVFGKDARFYFASQNLMYSAPDHTIRIPANYGAGAEITHWMPLPEPPEADHEE